MKFIVTTFLLAAASLFAGDVTGTWVITDPRGDGTFRRTYFNLKREDNGKITGTVRIGVDIYNITEGRGTPERFVIFTTRKTGNERKVNFEGGVSGPNGDELSIGEVKDGGANGMAGALKTARKAKPEDAALPARIDLPALHKVRDNGLARTPPMGWNSWNKFNRKIDDATVRGVADAIASNGMREAGYVYINIDDTWEGERDAQGNMTSNAKFPDMKTLSAYVHSKGLKIGIYSSPGPVTCEGYEGSYGHEVQDAKAFAAWGIDYLKYDWCGAGALYKNEEMQPLYQKMGDALAASGRKIVYSLCQYGRLDVWKWGPDVGGNLWRTTGDISDRWASMSRIGFNQDKLSEFARPGHWNDPDMLEIGNGGMSETEYQTHMSLWSMLAAPLIAGNDVRNVPAPILAILTNKEVIAIDQDKLGHQAKRISKSGDQEVWARDLTGGDHAVALFNLAADPAKITVAWKDIGLTKAPKRARDLWSHRDVMLSGEYSATVPAHGVVLLRVK
jgi:alpha-galactosidase